MYSPGLEGNFRIYKGLGLQLGASVYFQDYNEAQIVNLTDGTFFNFYNANIGICHTRQLKGDHYFGMTLGAKMYYGPNFTQLSYYSAGGYPIYMDGSHLRVATGIDLGIYYSYRRTSLLLKYDTARNHFRFGVGFRFIKRPAAGG
ncbi:MAG: hypothetical protein JW801_09235 [Bacteroidales bacterium]|nr:hypothetical protein [Bacteroidales bacterium]